MYVASRTKTIYDVIQNILYYSVLREKVLFEKQHWGGKRSSQLRMSVGMFLKNGSNPVVTQQSLHCVVSLQG